MNGFVYCWTDHKTNKLYIGSHKGCVDDGYVCSSKHMMIEYNKRPQDFTRQIVAEGNLNDIRKLESKILQAANVRIDEQFYNKHDNDGFFFNGWKQGEFSEEHRKNMSISASKRKRTLEHIHKLHEGRKNSKNSVEHVAALKTARLLQEKKRKESGYYQSNEWKIIAAKTQETKRKKKEVLVNGD
jgi:hypothetical protein